jgi:D-sedoheptulose 7-phosphate isomerase
MTNSNYELLLKHVKQTIEESIKAKRDFYEKYSSHVCDAAQLMASTVVSGGKILIFGNGGSAADSQHMAAEMTGRMLVERKKPIPAIALTTDTSALTAIGNDYSFEDIFLLQLKALAKPNDLVIAISTSGNSKNVIKACEEAKKIGCKIIGLSGNTGGKLKQIADISLNVDLGKHSSMIQETHITIVHLLVDLMDRFLLPKDYVHVESK